MENNDENEEVEGLDDERVSGWGEYPLDSVFVRKEQRTISEVVKRIKADRYVLDPDFQRDFIWPPEKQSRLIESCMMRIPLPVFYVAEAEDGRIIVVDGLQRLTTFFRYLLDKFALKGLGANEDKDKKHPLNGKKFSSLSVKLQERIEDTQITLYILDEKAPERAKLDIFERVNGGVALTRQQMRNCLFSGQATKLLKSLSEDIRFVEATGGSLNTKNMRDRELINRFCAFKILDVQSYKGDMDDFLAKSLRKINELDDIALKELREEFLLSMQHCKVLFGKHAFRKSLIYKNQNIDRSVINASLFDVTSVLLSDLSFEEFKNNKSMIENMFVSLLEDIDFNDSISISTNTEWRVKARFSIAENALEKTLNGSQIS